MADCSEAIANQILSMTDEKYEQYASVIDAVCKFGAETLGISKEAMNSFTTLDLSLANSIVDRSKRIEEMEKTLTELVVTTVQDRKIALALRGIVSNLVHISRSAQLVSEVAINRYLETNNDVCQFWKERKSVEDGQYLKKVAA